MEEVLAQTDEWPARHPAVGVVRADGSTSVHGPTDRVTRWASITKVLTAWATLVAVQDGFLHLDEPAGPEGSTVRHLLAHASGLPPEQGGPTGRVGRRRVYSNHGYELLADLVAGRVGEPFADHLQAEVLDPLGLTGASLDGSPAHGASGTLADLLALGAELLAPTLLGDELAEAVATVQFPGLSGVLPGYGRQDDNTWGLGVEIRDGKSPHWTGPSQPPDTFGHFGRSGSYLWVDRALGAACGCLTGRDFGEWAAEAWAPFNDTVWKALH